MNIETNVKIKQFAPQTKEQEDQHQTELAELREFLDTKETLFEYNYRDELETLSAKIEKMGVALSEFKQSSLNWDIFVYYLKGKGIPKKDLDHVMSGVEDFFTDAGIEI